MILYSGGSINRESPVHFTMQISILFFRSPIDSTLFYIDCNIINILKNIKLGTVPESVIDADPPQIDKQQFCQSIPDPHFVDPLGGGGGEEGG